MHFVFPAFLFALFALAVPILIHLFYFRKYKKIYFSDIRFLKEVQEQKSTIDKLKKRLILLSRLLALFFLVLAFAQPFFGRKEKNNNVSTYAAIYIDNSPSTQLIKNGEAVLDICKQKAKAIAEALNDNDKLAIITNDIYNPNQRWMLKDDFLNALDQIKPSYQQKNLEEIILKQNALLSNVGAVNKERFIISDFQTNMLASIKDTSYSTYLIPIQTEAKSNLFVDTCWFENPIVQLNTTLKLLVRFKNTGSELVSKKPATLKINNQIKTVKDISVDAFSSVIDSFNFSISTAGNQNLAIEFNDYPITYDDVFYANFEVKQNETILNIEDLNTPNNIQAVFANDNYFKLTTINVNQIDYSSLKTYDFIILNQLNEIASGLANTLNEFVANGGSIYIIPSASALISNYNAFLNQMQIGSFGNLKQQKSMVKQLNLNDKIFKGIFSQLPKNIDLPSVEQFYSIQSANSVRQYDILPTTNGTALISKYNVGKGIVYLQSSPLQSGFTNLGSKAIFAPIVYNMAVQKNYAPPLYYTIGKDNQIELNHINKNPTAQLSIGSEKTEFIPESRTIGNVQYLFINQNLEQDGIYSIKEDKQAIGKSIAFNFDRKESELKFTDLKNLENQFNLPNFKIIEQQKSNIFAQVKHIKDGTVLWKIFVVLALVCLLAEILLIRFLK